MTLNNLNKSKIVLNTQFDIEFSHHYGVKRFRKVGATIINCINREYCKDYSYASKSSSSSLP